MSRIILMAKLHLYFYGLKTAGFIFLLQTVDSALILIDFVIFPVLEKVNNNHRD